MSTKATLVHGDNFHFYRELFDEKHLYLEVCGTEFEAGPNRVMVAIPLPIWEMIRTQGAVDLSLANKTDAELQVLTEQRVDELIAQYVEQKDKPTGRRLYRDREAERPRDEQIAEILEELHTERQQQQEIAAVIEAIRMKNRKTGLLL